MESSKEKKEEKMKGITITFIILFTGSLFAKKPVDFDTSMEYHKQDRFAKKRLQKIDLPITRLCRKLYNKNNLQQVTFVNKPLIPNIVHLIWLGPNKPPAIFQNCLASIQEYMPTWTCKIWTDDDVESFNLVNKRYYDKESNYGAKSDIFRYEILYRYGGVYLDVDMVLLKPLDILHHTYKFYTSLLPSYCTGILANGIIGSAPGHPILKQCIKDIKKHRDDKWLIERTGPIHFQKSFYTALKKINKDRIIAFPKSFFIPADKYETYMLHTKPESFALHYWEGSWHPKKNKRHSKIKTHKKTP